MQYAKECLRNFVNHNMKIIGIIITAVSTIVIGAIWRGYVLSVLWTWFIVATFGAQPIGIAAAIGIALLWGFLCANHAKEKDDSGDTAVKKFIAGIAEMILAPAFSLFVGWIVKHWL